MQKKISKVIAEKKDNENNERNMLKTVNSQYTKTQDPREDQEENIFEEIIAENSPTLMRCINPLV